MWVSIAVRFGDMLKYHECDKEIIVIPHLQLTKQKTKQNSMLIFDGDEAEEPTAALDQF